MMVTLAFNELILEAKFGDGPLETRKLMTNGSMYSKMDQVKFVEGSL